MSNVQRRWWDLDAERYHAEHENYLSSFYWCPEMLHEKDAQLLGDVSGARVLEIGCGSAPCTAWLADANTNANAVLTTGFDISAGMLRHAHPGLPLVQADARAFPYRSGSFDVAFSAFGALPFVDNIDTVFSEVARVLVPGGRFVFSVNHPMRWVFPDDPGIGGLIAGISYFEAHYAEYDDDGALTYIEYQRTMGDWVRAINQAGFRLRDLIEPEWPDDVEETWGQWSPLRGKIFPGTAIFVTELTDNTGSRP